MKKSVLVVLVIMLSSISFAQSGWYSLTDSMPNLYMTAIQFTSQNTGYASGSYNNDSAGVFWKTTNAGMNWQKTHYSGMSVDGISFLNDLTGYFIGYGGTYPPLYNIKGYIFKTTDGALSWVRKDSIPDGNFFEIKFYDVNTGLIVGKRGQAFTTTNGGINWNDLHLTYNFWYEPNCIWCFDANTWLVSDNSSISKTTNLGVNWTQDDSSDAHSLYFLNNTTGFRTSDYGAVYKSTNSGTNWTKIFNGEIYGFYSRSLKFTNANTGYMCGMNSMSIFKTTNGGYNWTGQIVNANSSWTSLSFINDNTGYVSGYYGRIFKTTNGGSVFVNNISSEVPDKYSLGQNYPNPFNSSSNLKFEIVNLGNVKISVYDVQGREVQTIVNERLQAGTYEVRFDGSGLTSGVYFYRMETDGYSETRKMILMK